MHILAGTQFRVMPGCSSIKDIEKSVLNHHVYLALVGVNKDGNELLPELLALKVQFEYLRIVLFTDQFNLEEFLTAVASGVDCYLLKNEITRDALLKSLDLVLLGETIVPQQFTQLLRNQIHRQQEILSGSNYLETYLAHPRAQSSTEVLRAGDTVRLSTQEQVILLQLTHGASNKHIARELKISEATVKTHVKALLHKIRVSNRTQAAVWATNRLGSLRVDDAKSLKPSTGFLGPLGQLGGLGLDPAVGPPAADIREASRFSSTS
jgi:two-component system nitrate/nitrite response regulator NarL